MNPGRLKPLWALLFFALSLALLNRLNQYQVSQDPRHQLPFPTATNASEAKAPNTAFIRAYQERVSGLQLSVSGKITHVFPSPETGDQHQKFIVQLDAGQSVMVIHNRALGSAIDGLLEGETIEVFGEYQWDQGGGIIRRTHQDPASHRQAGWVKYKGRIYR